LREGHVFGIEGRLDGFFRQRVGKRQARLLKEGREDKQKPLWQRAAKWGK
jgi:hypothetical protein